MSIPSFKESFEGNLGPDITIIANGNYFDTDEHTENLSLSTINKEAEETTVEGDRIEFMTYNAPEDQFLKFFQENKGKILH